MSSEANEVGQSNPVILYQLIRSVEPYCALQCRWLARFATSTARSAFRFSQALSMPLFRNARFETSIAKPGDLPKPFGPEVAFAGRSNAGKSSAINTLAGHTRLAFVSKTPGRTQLINYFRLNCGAALVDLPGYGYAQVPERIRVQWRALLESYLRGRSNLIGLILIMDSRHPLTTLDRQMLDWYAPNGRPVHVLLTKADKLSRNEAGSTLLVVRRELSAWGPQVTAQLFSSLKKMGVEEVEAVVGRWLGVEEDAAAEGLVQK
jgi:GTP-binding protein